MALFQRKPAAPTASELRRERRALLSIRDQFNETLVVERCAELVAIETRISEIDAIVSGLGLRRRQQAICRCGAPLLVGARFCPSCGRALDDDEDGTIA